ncbi:pyruvate kinase alpha/beta domain-containing protein [Chloroflexota bacterium]
MELKTVYFDNPGRQNTAEVLRIARQRAAELGIEKIVVASTRGDTAVQAVDVLQGSKVIAVSHVTGFHEPNTQTFTGKNRKLIESKGGIIVTAAHAFAGLSRALRHKHNMYVLGEIVADTLRVFGHGTKVACEVTMMAADCGLVSSGEDVIAIGGTGLGADTALVIKAANTHRFFDLKVQEILCKPRF